MSKNDDFSVLMPDIGSHLSDPLSPKILICGVGGAGGSALKNIHESGLGGVYLYVMNTDNQALKQSPVGDKLQMGRGLGAGADPGVGKMAAIEAEEQIRRALDGYDMLFIALGLGGGTGTGAGPEIARIARELGILVVVVCTKPFHFEGMRRMKIAELGLEELEKHSDALIVIPNQNLFCIANENTTLMEAFSLADSVLVNGVRGIVTLITETGIINLDFADVLSIMRGMGRAMFGSGEDADAVIAAEKAMSNPLLDNMPISGARQVLINITGGKNMTLFQVDIATKRITDQVNPDANIIFGAVYDPNLENKIRVSVFATGLQQQKPQTYNVQQPMSGLILDVSDKNNIHSNGNNSVDGGSTISSSHNTKQWNTKNNSINNNIDNNVNICEPTMQLYHHAPNKNILSTTSVKFDVSDNSNVISERIPEANIKIGNLFESESVISKIHISQDCIGTNKNTSANNTTIIRDTSTVHAAINFEEITNQPAFLRRRQQTEN